MGNIHNFFHGGVLGACVGLFMQTTLQVFLDKRFGGSLEKIVKGLEMNVSYLNGIDLHKFGEIFF